MDAKNGAVVKDRRAPSMYDSSPILIRSGQMLVSEMVGGRVGDAQLYLATIGGRNILLHERFDSLVPFSN